MQFRETIANLKDEFEDKMEGQKQAIFNIRQEMEQKDEEDVEGTEAQSRNIDVLGLKKSSITSEEDQNLQRTSTYDLNCMYLKSAKKDPQLKRELFRRQDTD